MRLLSAASTFALGILLAAPVSAQDVTFYFTAKVASVDDRAGVLAGAVKDGDEITGSYSYRMGTPDDNDAPTVGDYWHRSRPYGITVNMAGRRFFTHPDRVEFLVELVNDHGEPASDHYLLRSYQNLVEPPLPAGGVDHISWQLDDETLQGLSSADLTAKPPVLSAFRSDYGLTIDGCGSSGSTGFCMDRLMVRAHVTSIGTAPPTPGKAPVAYWTFDSFQAGMVSPDVTGHGYELACMHGRAGLQHVQGAVGRALEFTGKGFELEVAESRGAFNFAQGTVETIAYYLPGEDQVLFSNATALQGVLRGWEFLVDASGRLAFRQANDRIQKRWFTTSSRKVLGPRKAYHLAAVFDRKQVALYIDGERVAAGPAIAYRSSAMKANVGHGYAPIAQYRDPFRGSLDEMKLYDAALDAAAIKAKFADVRARIDELNALRAR